MRKRFHDDPELRKDVSRLGNYGSNFERVTERCNREGVDMPFNPVVGRRSLADLKKSGLSVNDRGHLEIDR